MSGRVLSILAHPDDAEILCAGTMLRLRSLGWDVHIATMTPGDCGSRDFSRKEISRIRKKEARESAARAGGSYYCLGSKDLLVCFDAPHIRRTVEVIRKVNPDIVITHSPADYMPDHEFASLLARAACFGAPVVNFDTKTAHPSPATGHIPHLYYCLPLGGHDIFGVPVAPSVVVDVSEVLHEKLEMLACHRSQREWLKAQHGVDDYLETTKRWCADLGSAHGKAYAEGFRQHRGHAYPQDDLLASLLT
ncbi:MAG TPA: PIG-L family deacetylase [Bryobacteraceae bacterium]|jgi:LmbE family N-acetylglucosaminyl deacetylase|nr:PIG-L family deacetylase [Bryobacteraceae bacterium]